MPSQLACLFDSRKVMMVLRTLVASNLATVVVLCLAASPDAQSLTTRERALAKTADAVHAFNDGQFEQAADLLGEALSLDESLCEAHFWLARVHAIRIEEDPEARQAALHHFRRAFELNPYGELGQLLRGWLYKFGGRPDVARLLPARLEDTDVSSSGTRELLRALSTPCEESARLPFGFQCGDEWTSPADLTPERLRQYVAPGPATGEAGWVCLIAVFDCEHNWSDDGIPLVSAKARVWIADPILEMVHDAVTVSGSSASIVNLLYVLFPDGPGPTLEDATNLCMSALRDQVLDVFQRCAVDPYDLALCDETLVPLDEPGVFARAATGDDYGAVKSRPVIVQTSAQPDEDRDVFGRALEQYQRSIIDDAHYNLVSSAAASAFCETQVRARPVDCGQYLAERVGARAVCSVTFEPLKIWTTTHFGTRRVHARAIAHVKVWDQKSGDLVFSDDVVARKSISRFMLVSDDALLTLAAKARGTVADDLAAALAAAVAECLPAPTGAERAGRVTL
jgi:tetratricopeptide (TPR) repeat protein